MDKVSEDSGMLSDVHRDLSVAKVLLFDRCKFNFSGLKEEVESKEYGAYSFRLNEMNIKFRVAKITPTKAGQFVTIWKRDQGGVTQPFDALDEIDFIIISCRDRDNVGQFIFPQSVLIEKGIITNNTKQGKRGIRVYPPWAKVSNKQAEKTQRWQTKYFLTIKDDDSTDLDFIKRLFAQNRNEDN